MNDLVSVIIPVYNVENYVGETLESVLAQSYSNMEVIVINDGSTDNSLEIIRRYEERDSRIKIVTKKNEGLGAARELGVAMAQGKFFVTIDSDDVLDDEYIQNLYTAIIENDADIALCARKSFDENGEDVLLLDKNIISPLEVTLEMLENQYNFIAGTYQMSDSWNKMYRKKFVVEADVHFSLPRQYNGTDLFFNYSLLLHMPKFVVVNEPLYFYRLTQNSRVRRKNKHLENGFRYILEKLLVENRKYLGSKQVENQIYASYLSMIKYATQDLSGEIKQLTRKEQIESYATLLETVPIFEKYSKREILRASSSSLRFFVRLVFMRSAKGIYYYYKIRTLWRR